MLKEKKFETMGGVGMVAQVGRVRLICGIFAKHARAFLVEVYVVCCTDARGRWRCFGLSVDLVYNSRCYIIFGQ